MLVPRALAVIPHPDDESYSFGGTLALLAGAGWEVVVCCASSGEKGKRHDDGPADPVSVGMAREAELADSCRILGADAPLFLRLPDGALAGVRGGVGLVRDIVRRLSPQLVFTLGADGAYGHPDHVSLHRWVTRAVDEAGPAILVAAFPKGLFVPQWLKCIRMMGEPPRPAQHQIGTANCDYEADIRPVRETKLRSLACHRTQLPGGEAEAIFPPGIVAALLDRERFEDGSGGPRPWVREVFDSLRR